MFFRVLSALQRVCPGKGSGGRFVNSLLVMMSRIWLYRRLICPQLNAPDDVTVILGVKDRCDYRLVNALRSLREQTHHALRILVVDYGSEVGIAENVRHLSEQFGAEYFHVGNKVRWSRSQCLNIGLRMVKTKFVLVSDVDIVFSPSYVSDAIALIAKYPLSVVCSTMLDLSAEASDDLIRASRGAQLDMLELKERSVARRRRRTHSSILLTHTQVLTAIRGYDEFYCDWGSEDDDLMCRLERIGLHRCALDTDSFYLHQWHPKFEGVSEWKSAARRNRDYFLASKSILRNDRNWGSL